MWCKSRMTLLKNGFHWTDTASYRVRNEHLLIIHIIIQQKVCASDWEQRLPNSGKKLVKNTIFNMWWKTLILTPNFFNEHLRRFRNYRRNKNIKHGNKWILSLGMWFNTFKNVSGEVASCLMFCYTVVFHCLRCEKHSIRPNKECIGIYFYSFNFFPFSQAVFAWDIWKQLSTLHLLRFCLK